MSAEMLNALLYDPANSGRLTPEQRKQLQTQMNARTPTPYGEPSTRVAAGLVSRTAGFGLGETSSTATVPSVPTLDPSAAKVSAIDAAQRQRRRAAAGSAGRVTTGTPTLLQQQITAGRTPRTLIGQ